MVKLREPIKLSIIVVNYNLAEEVQECLVSVFAHADMSIVEIIVVDNNSIERNIEKVAEQFPPEKFPQIKFYYLDSNRGFGAGNNYGASKSTGESLLFLNPDATLISNPVNVIEREFSNNSEIAILGPRIIDKNGKPENSHGGFIGPLTATAEFFLLPGFGRKLAKTGEGQLTIVDWVTGAALFMRRNVFEMVGGFDEDYFLYNEEVDLCKRTLSAGYKTAFLNSTFVCHTGSVGSKKNYYNL